MLAVSAVITQTAIVNSVEKKESLPPVNSRMEPPLEKLHPPELQVEDPLPTPSTLLVRPTDDGVGC